MKLLGLKEAWVLIILSCILTILYVQSRQGDHDELYEVNALIQEIKAVDLSLELDVMQLHAGRLHHYDTITKGSVVLDELLQKLQPYIEFMPGLADFQKALESSVRVQKDALEHFKRNNALFRNSLRYFPALIDQAATDQPELRLYLTHVYNDLLRSMALPEKATLSHLGSYVGRLEAVSPNLAKHLQVMVDSERRTRVEMQEFIYCGTEENAEALFLAYKRHQDTLMTTSEFYQVALVFFSALLLLYVGIIMFRLQRIATELKEANAELQYQKFALDEHAIVDVMDAQGNITYANQKLCEISGYSKEELLGKNYRLLKPEGHFDELYREMWDAISSGQTWHGELENRAKSGEFYWVNSSIVPFLNAKGKSYKYVSIRTDITARKETEEAQKKLTAAFYYAAEALMITDAQGGIEHVNPAFEKMTGYLEEEIQGKPAIILRSTQHDALFYDELVKTIGEGEVWKGELVLLCKDRSEKPTLRSIAPVFGEKGDLVNYVTFMTDMTEEKLLRSKLEHTQRLESLGVMAGGIAHDFNNILTSIMGNAKLAEIKMTGGKRGDSPYLSRISKASERAADLCRQMLSYSGQGNLEMRPINLSELVHEVASLLEVAVAENITIQYHLGKQLPSIEADSGQLQQVIMNLITNAGESYLDGAGKVEIDVGTMYVGQSWLASSLLGEELKEGEYIYVEVKDYGSGMDQETLDHVFEPFFTTKFTGRGLGMSAMMGIVKAHRGAIDIYSEQGQGTMVRVVFPIVDQPAEPLVSDFSLAGGYAKSLIMIVDDEADILEYAKTLLADLGHDVITAASGEEALEIFQKEQRKIDVVITDAGMPGMSGDQLCKELHALDERVKLILSSGYDMDYTTQSVQSGLLSGLIQKPYSPEKFSYEVCKVLD